VFLLLRIIKKRTPPKKMSQSDYCALVTTNTLSQLNKTVY